MLLALDSNVLIAAIVGSEKHSEAAQRLLSSIAQNKHSAISSTLIFAEVFALSYTDKGLGDISLGQFFASLDRYLQTIDVDTGLSQLAGRLGREYGSSLKLADAVHLATAIESKADVFLTNDLRLAKVAAKIIPTKTLATFKID